MDPREISRPWGDKNSQSQFNMVDVTAKSPTVRRAEATGSIRMTPAAFAMVRDRRLPKGDALMLAEVAGILGAKQTPSLLPLCHPLPLEEIKVHCDLDEANASVHVTCVVSTTAKTGVEMEALMGTSTALLCLYDLIKMVEPALVLEQVRLNFKEGGKKGLWLHPESKDVSAPVPELARPLAATCCGVLTISDRVSAGTAEDQSGPAAALWLRDQGAAAVESTVVPDEMKRIQSAIQSFAERGLPLVISTGGTGMGPRDVTIAALAALGAKEAKGIGELLRQSGSVRKRAAWLSSASGFIVHKTLIVALPGSPKAVREGLAALADLLPHAIHIIQGGNHG